ncbi:NAD(P)/FAD-dependent oxidoreductase [Micromonospora sp. WMMA1947]|uniref:NAD(P)/FAD-dependent oxidoreductase n=1 Tax=Micromonospora sp. WMMA1947 TaxID=3015163 RepID=UPI00248C3003|nr:NAD(P)/FAD-dependent oxidoreductase [Micromonospora sp. WMMA1947]WBC07478.1 NAD(P)/FAD-dependent oxidoreductase [Micromonospora sp. WMMA1947]
MYDAIVVGARCAGSTTAMLLARAGHRVLLLDRATFPSDTMSTHYVHQPTIARLARWGLLDELQQSGCPPLEVARWTLSGFSVTGCAPPVDGIRAAYGPRRYVLDTMLVRAAGAAGAEVREGVNVNGLFWEDGRVVGVIGSSDRGTPFTERARVVIGADGIDSVVARSVEAPMYEEVPTLCCLYYTYWSGVPADYEVYVNQRRAVGVVPTNDGRVMVGIQWPREEFEDVRKDVEGNYWKALEVASPAFAERLREGRREERFVGTGRLPNFFRQATGPGWALVGDAGFHKDPVGAFGISDAVRHADLLAEHLIPALSQDGPLEPALERFGVRRDEDAMPEYYFNLQAARLEPMPELLDVLRVIEGDQEQVDRFFGLIAGMYTWQEFFTDDLIARTEAARARSGGDQPI